MTDRKLAGLCLCLGLMLAGCNPEAPAWSPADTSPKPLKVDYVKLQHPAAFAPGSAKLAAGEPEKLAAFLDNAQVTSEDHVYLEPASGDALAAQRIGQLAHQLSQHGIGATTLPPAAEGVAPNQLLVLVERYVVTPPNCPDWSKDPVSNHDNTPPSNFGCATVTNLGLMVADPRDLVIGRKLGPEVGDPALYAIERYQAGKPKSTASGGSSGPTMNVSVSNSGGGGQ
jgi:pilus assembly protein CpaD